MDPKQDDPSCKGPLFRWRLDDEAVTAAKEGEPMHASYSRVCAQDASSCSCRFPHSFSLHINVYICIYMSILHTIYMYVHIHCIHRHVYIHM